MPETINPNPNLIDRLPTADELREQAEQREQISMAISRRALDAIMRGETTETDPVKLNQKYPVGHSTERPKLPDEPVHEPLAPWIKPEIDRTISGEELRELRERVLGQANPANQPNEPK